MSFIDIHSHILHGVDDGARNLGMSIELLRMMKAQGITDVVATPHFDARYQNFEEYTESVQTAYKQLKEAVIGEELPNIYLGSEVYYFKGIGNCYGIKDFAIENSKYLLLELSRMPIDDEVIKDICDIYDNIGLRPVLAHLERYVGVKGFKKILKLVESGVVLAQINASSVFIFHFKRAVKKLIKRGYVSFLATDTHSTDLRPPLLDKALDAIEKQFGKEHRELLIRNSEEFLDLIKNN